MTGERGLMGSGGGKDLRMGFLAEARRVSVGESDGESVSTEYRSSSSSSSSSSSCFLFFFFFFFLFFREIMSILIGFRVDSLPEAV